MNKNLQEIIKDMNIVVVMKFGSHLYGTNTPNSDEDYKGIFIPKIEDVLLNRIPKHIKYNSGGDGCKNNKDDVDIELYSIHYFLELAYKGETIAIDMLHCNSENVISFSDVWIDIRKNRNKFYTNNLKGFVGYCRKQAAKYGIKGSRLADAKTVYDFLLKYAHSPIDTRLGDIWAHLPTGEHIHFVKAKTHGDVEEEFYQVCGKKLQRTSKVLYCLSVLKSFRDSYGHRALLAEKNKGINWKAVSHAMRYAMQIRELFNTGDIKFPLAHAEYLKEIKLGKLDYIGEVAPELETLMNEIEILSTKTTFPNKPDKKFWDNWLINLLHSNS